MQRTLFAAGCLLLGACSVTREVRHDDDPEGAPHVLVLTEETTEPVVVDPAVTQPLSLPREDDGPWRLEEALGAPDWLSLSIEQRSRYEGYNRDFRASATANSTRSDGYVLRTLVDLAARVDAWTFHGEFVDSRTYDFAENAPLNTGTVNAVELLQGYVGYTLSDLFEEGDSLQVKVGRQTIDTGGRRLAARNGYRNTINNFGGIYGDFRTADGDRLEAFAVFPTRRLPNDRGEIQDNEVTFDEEQEGQFFFALHGTTNVYEGTTGELYVYGLDEQDKGSIATRDRHLWTFGARMLKKPQRGKAFAEWESMYQIGESRSSSGSTADLDHEAHYHHLSIGYQFDVESRFQIEGLFDYASGDDDPTDGENNRFDTLFGQRRDYGSPGIFGAYARANLISPGLRIKWKPLEGTSLYLAHRFNYLASKRDAWVPGGLVDPDGNSGRHIGEMSELRIKQDIFPESLQLQGGMVYLTEGSFVENAPNATGQGDSAYVWLGWTFWI